MTPIRKLPPEVVREIAAGEVVSAPVDVLKELVENALDAGATRLGVTLEEGGIRCISVRDNGVGIPAAELPLATDAHSTSKLGLQSGSLQDIRTLGFRGEGLYAVRHAARLSLTSRPRDQLGGVTLTVQGDELETHAHPAPSGTRAVVTELFARLPARYQALGSPAAETKRAVSLLGRYLLHHPHLQVSLETNGEMRWGYAGGSFLEAAKFLWGPVTANRLLALTFQGDGITVQGIVSRPELTRPRRDRLLVAVNGRPVEWDEALLRAVLTPYRELLSVGSLPSRRAQPHPAAGHGFGQHHARQDARPVVATYRSCRRRAGGSRRSLERTTPRTHPARVFGPAGGRRCATSSLSGAALSGHLPRAVFARRGRGAALGRRSARRARTHLVRGALRTVQKRTTLPNSPTPNFCR